jgi:MFS family permease
MYSRGTVNAFGVFQTYYENNLLQDQSPSNISWIGSIQAFLLLVVGVITGPLYDAGYFRPLISLGAFLIPFGFMMTSICSQYWQVMLAQAICIGLGNGCLFVPSVAILPQYFSTRKALANGIAASGSSLGGVIYPIVFRQLYPRIGFPWATRVLGFISLFAGLISVAVMKVRIMPKQKRALLELAAFKEIPYASFCIALFFGFIGFFGPIYYLQPYAINTGITDENLGFYLLPILNAASIAGRILPNFVTDKAGPLNILIPAALISGLLGVVWIGIKNLPGMIIFAILYGFFSGGYVSLAPVAIISLTPDMRTLGTRMGQSFFVSSLGLLVGSPVAGEILNKTGSYLGLQLFSGLTVFLTGVLLVWTRFTKVGMKVKIKV